MPNDVKIKSEAFSGRQHVKWVKLMIGVGARALFAAFWAGDPGPGGHGRVGDLQNLQFGDVGENSPGA